MSMSFCACSSSLMIVFELEGQPTQVKPWAFLILDTRLRQSL